jgi:archaemetzincin
MLAMAYLRFVVIRNSPSYQQRSGQKTSGPKDSQKQGGQSVSDAQAMADFALNDDSDFEKMKPPKPGDWLARFDEPGQTFDEYVKSKPLRPDKTRSVIVIQPLGVFTDTEKTLMDKLKLFTNAFFQITVELKPEMALSETTKYKRLRESQAKTWMQYRTDYLREDVLEPNLPRNAFCYLGVTMTDLYPNDKWNYVFGEASLKGRVGVYSLVRYFPAFWGEPDTAENRLRTLRRSYSTLAHETGHMFGVLHCIYYECLMCGSNNLDESDRRPLRLCPVCLKKLQWNIGFDVIKRYEELEKIYQANELTPEADWITKRLAKIKSAGQPDK